jgi:hypothetical protein
MSLGQRRVYFRGGFRQRVAVPSGLAGAGGLEHTGNTIPPDLPEPAPIVLGRMTVYNLLDAVRGMPYGAPVLIATGAGLARLHHVGATFVSRDNDLREITQHAGRYAVVLTAADK